MKTEFNFKIETSASAGGGRAGILHTPHGDIRTPAFAPVGTKAGVKGILPGQLKELGAEVVLANTYHLYLQPGEQVVKEGGGLGKFMSWSGPTITDSGGFQVFSLGAGFGKKVSKFVTSSEAEGEISEKEGQIAVYDEELATSHGKLAIIDDDGVSFTSHIDGSLHRFTPERSVEIQHALGADIFFAFDECTAPTESYEYQKEAMERTHRWAERSLKHHRHFEAGLPAEASSRRQAIFGIAQGGQFDDLRRISAKTIAEMGFDGFGLGGSFSKKYGDDSLESALAMLKELPPEMPVHGLGIGEPGDILASIAAGVDLFDCVAPTRLGRHGTIYTKHGLVHLKNEKHRSDFSLLDPEMKDLGGLSSNEGPPRSFTQGFTRAYVSHLLRSGEMLGSIIASLHNVGFILNLIAGARQAILDGRFSEYREEFVRNYYK